MTGDRLTTLAPLLLVGMLAALTYWLEQIAQPPVHVSSATADDPDYFVDRLAAVSMDPSGAERYTLSAEKMVHYPDGDTTLLTAPRFVSHDTANAPVTITAREAVVSANGQHVYFQHDVRVTRAAHGSSSELVVTTEFLHVIPDAGLARTDRAVTISNAAGTVSATGFELDNRTRVIRLHSSVRGSYDQSKASGR